MTFGQEKIRKVLNSILTYAQGPVLVVLAYFVLQYFDRKGWDVVSPGIVYMAAIVFIAFMYGLSPALATAAAALGIGLFSFSLPGHWFNYSTTDSVRLSLWFVFFPVVAVLTGLLKRHNDRELERQSRAVVEKRTRSLEEQLQESRGQLAVILNGVADAVLIQHVSGKLAHANDMAARLLGLPAANDVLKLKAGEILKDYEVFDEQGRPFPAESLPGARALAQGIPSEAVLQFKLKRTGDAKWANVAAKPVFDSSGRVTFAVTVFRDITAQKQAEESARLAAERAGFLAEASEVLFSSLDYEQTFAAITRLAVPKIADWCAVDLLEEGVIRRMAVAHVDPRKIALAKELEKRFPTSVDSPGGVAKVIRSGEVIYLSSVTDEMLVTGAQSDEHLRLMRTIGFESVVVAPLKVKGKAFGALILVTSESRRRLTQEDVNLAQELARRAALAIENSKLYRQAMAAAAKEREQSELFNSVLTNAPVGFAFVNLNFEYARINSRLAEMLGVNRGELIGKGLGGLSPEVSELLRAHFEKVLETKQSVVNQEVAGRLARDPARLRHWVVSLFPIFGLKDELLGVGMIVDETTEDKRIQAEMNYYATHDVLTGLPNRKVFEEYTSRAIEQAQKDNAKVAVLVLDLDRFKNINDSLGHEAGDQVMKEVAARLRSILHAEDMVARWGGDEFVVALPGLQGIFEINRVADRILKAFDPVIRLQQHTLHVSTTIGIAVYPRDGHDATTLLKNGDAALYRAKELGKNRFEFYKAESDLAAGDQLTLETDLRLAVEAGQMHLHFQPIIELRSGQVVAAEALVRWQHPTLGVLRPRQFIPLAESVGLIVPLGKWIIEEAARQAQSWNEAGFGRIGVAVNLSSRQFADESLVPIVRGALESSGLDPELLELEITESLAMENVDRTRNKIIELNSMGVGITIDDFGTGYSSLSYLRSFPVSKLKIDKSFVKHSITEEQDAQIIRAICALADSLRLKVIAEGVDTEQQMGLLSSLGCYAAQGYLISKPLAASAFREWLAVGGRNSISSVSGIIPAAGTEADSPQP